MTLYIKDTGGGLSINGQDVEPKRIVIYNDLGIVKKLLTYQEAITVLMSQD